MNVTPMSIGLRLPSCPFSSFFSSLLSFLLLSLSFFRFFFFFFFFSLSLSTHSFCFFIPLVFLLIFRSPFFVSSFYLLLLPFSSCSSSFLSSTLFSPPVLVSLVSLVFHVGELSILFFPSRKWKRERRKKKGKNSIFRLTQCITR